MTAPERIWLDWPAANRGDPVYDEPPERDTQPGQTGYIRADLYTALQARLDEVEAKRDAMARTHEADYRRWQETTTSWAARAEAAEAAAATARADALREAAGVFDELWRENDAVKRAAILALIDRPADPTPPQYVGMRIIE